MRSVPQEISDAHITKIDDLGNLVSNLNITTRADNTPDVVLRGVGSFGVVSGVGFYANDVQLFDGQTVRTEDIERIEVLKGPTGHAVRRQQHRRRDQVHHQDCPPMTSRPARASNSATTAPKPIPVSFPVRWFPALDARASFFDTHTDGYIYDTTLNRKVDGGSERGGRLTFSYKNRCDHGHPVPQLRLESTRRAAPIFTTGPIRRPITRCKWRTAPRPRICADFTRQR